MLVVALFLVLLNGFFVAAEFAMVRVRATRVDQLLREGNRRAGVVQAVLKDLDGHLSACQLGITLASLGLGWIGEPALARLIEPAVKALVGWRPGLDPAILVHTIALVIAFALIAWFHIVLGELAPKSLAILQPETMALWTAGPLRLFYWLFRWPIRLLNGTSLWILRIMGVRRPTAHEMAHTDEELRILISASARGGYLDETERVILDNVFDFTERVAREVVVPRKEMAVLYVEETLEENLRVARAEGHTRYPLCREDKDHVLGLVHIKDLFTRAGEIRDLKEIMRPILMVPDVISVSWLLQEFQRKRTQMAVLVDEYGGTVGLVTIEDVLEEIVGEIRDEFDEAVEPELKQVAPGVYEADGGILWEDAANQLGFTVEEAPDVDTLGGYVLSSLGRQPAVGDAVDLGAYGAEVLAVDGFRITRLRMTRRPGTEPPQAPGPEVPNLPGGSPSPSEKQS